MKKTIATFAFALLLNNVLHADVLEWNFDITEQQVKNGPEADGSTNSPGFGTGTVTYDSNTNILSYAFEWDGLVGDLTKLHIHGPADVNSSNPQHVVEIYGPPAVPPELVSNSANITGTQELDTLIQTGFDPLEPEDILEIMTSGNAYLNVHTTVFGTGEIRGNLGVPTPEPSAGLLMVCGIAAMGLLRKRQAS